MSSHKIQYRIYADDRTHHTGEECKAAKELQQSIAAAREYLKSVGLNGI